MIYYNNDSVKYDVLHKSSGKTLIYCDDDPVKYDLKSDNFHSALSKVSTVQYIIATEVHIMSRWRHLLDEPRFNAATVY